MQKKGLNRTEKSIGFHFRRIIRRNSPVDNYGNAEKGRIYKERVKGRIREKTEVLHRVVKEDFMTQKKISYWLKGIVILLGAMGVAFWGGLTAYAFYLRADKPENLFWTFIFASWYTAAFCYGILIEFWRVCTQIGKDNSFSRENASHFHQMGMCGVFAIIGFAIRLLYLAAEQALTMQFGIFVVAEILIALVFVVLCEALSRLILNAYEMKQENELTI